MKIQPSEAWKLDFVELMHLTGQESKSPNDISTMLNFERKQNGASLHWLNGVESCQKN